MSRLSLDMASMAPCLIWRGGAVQRIPPCKETRILARDGSQLWALLLILDLLAVLHSTGRNTTQ